jgi:hypothetical protein
MVPTKLEFHGSGVAVVRRMVRAHSVSKYLFDIAGLLPTRQLLALPVALGSRTAWRRTHPPQKSMPTPAPIRSRLALGLQVLLASLLMPLLSDY